MNGTEDHGGSWEIINTPCEVRGYSGVILQLHIQQELS